MRVRRAIASIAAVAVILLSGSENTAAAQAPASSADQTVGDAVAFVNGVVISESELVARLASRLQRLNNEEYTLKRAALDELVVERLLAAEATRRKVTVPELLQSVVVDSVKQPTDEEVHAIYDLSRDRWGATQEKAFGQIRTQLVAQRMQRRRADFVRELKRSARVDVRLAAPRISVDVGNGPVEGPDGAPVTIVEFSDFECPYCGQFAETLKGIRSAYKGRIKFAYRHLPLAIHPNAKKAAEIATCAAKQGRFWPMHDKLFESLKRVQVGDWTAMAREAGVNIEALETCLNSPEAPKAWMADQRVAETFGITGTPALFLNGRLFTGAVPYDVLADAIEDELTRTSPVSP